MREAFDTAQGDDGPQSFRKVPDEFAQQPDVLIQRRGVGRGRLTAGEGVQRMPRFTFENSRA